MFEPGRLPDLAAFGDSSLSWQEETRGVKSKNTTCNVYAAARNLLNHVCLRKLDDDVKLVALPAEGFQFLFRHTFLRRASTILVIHAYAF